MQGVKVGGVYLPDSDELDRGPSDICIVTDVIIGVCFSFVKIVTEFNSIEKQIDLDVFKANYVNVQLVNNIY